MKHVHPDDAGASNATRTLAEVEPLPPHPFWLTVLATLGGLVIPAIVAIGAAYLLGPPQVAHASTAASLAALALTIAEAIFAGLGAATLVEAGWRRVGLPGSGPANFLPLRWIRHRIAHRHVQAIMARLREAPAQPARESVKSLLDLSRELARRDIYTRAHSGRVSRLSVEIGQKIGLTPEECEAARLAGLLHDIGKLEIPTSILNKPGPLDPDEAELVRRHPAIGAALIAPYIGPDVVDAVLHHHERIDGAGYPHGVDGDALPAVTRLVPVVDTYDALISDRAYRPGRSREEAFLELRAVAGSQLDSDLVEALIEVESAKVPFGAGILGLAPVTSLLRRAEHLLHGSAAPAAAAVTALAVAGAGWMGVISSANGTRVLASRIVQSIVKTSPSASASDQPSPTDNGSPAANAGLAPTGSSLPTPTDTGTGKPVAPLFFPTAVGAGKPAGKGVTAATGVLVAPPQAKNGAPVKTMTPIIVVGGPSPVPTNRPAGNPTPPGGPAPGPSSPPPPPAPPTMSGIAPGSGSSGTIVTINGANLACINSVMFGTAAAVIDSNNGSVLTVTAPSGQGRQTVAISGPCGVANNATFLYVGPNITSIDPGFGSIAGGTQVDIIGSGFGGNTAGVTVKFGNAIAAISSISDGQITVQSPSFSAAGNKQQVPVCVTTPAGTNCTTRAAGFNYGPNLTSMNPKTGTYQGGTVVTIGGTNLSDATAVEFGNTVVPVSVSGDFSLTFTTPPLSTTGQLVNTVQVRIGSRPCSNGGLCSATRNFTYTQLPPAPTISGITPVTSTVGGGPVTISGSHFSTPGYPVVVRFGGIIVQDAVVVNDNTITCTAPPAGTPGTVQVQVFTIGGRATTTYQYQ